MSVCLCVVGSHGQLGHGNRVKQVEPKVVQALAEHRVVMAACGAYHTMVADDRDRLFVFGKNFFGEVSQLHILLTYVSDQCSGVVWLWGLPG